jgi:hypothetical protein
MNSPILLLGDKFARVDWTKFPVRPKLSGLKKITGIYFPDHVISKTMNRFLVQKPTVTQLDKKFPTI